MRLIQCVFVLGIILSIDILTVKGQLKFDAEGNIIDDGLNLNVPSFPKEQKKPKPMVEKSSKMIPKAYRVMDNPASKGIHDSNFRGICTLKYYNILNE